MQENVKVAACPFELRRGWDSEATGADLLEDFGELTGGLQKRELALLAGEICV